MTTSTNLRLPASELAKLEPARSRGIAHAASPVEPVHAPRRLRRAVRNVVGYSRA